MKCLLVSLPFDTNINHIPLAVPMLSGQLERAGIKTDCIDFNAEMYSLFFTQGYLKNTLTKIKNEYSNLIKKENLNGDEISRFKIYKSILNNKPRIDGLMKTLPKFRENYIREKYKEGSRDFKDVLKIVLAPYKKYSPWNAYNWNYDYKNIKAFISDKENNIFYNFLLKYSKRFNFDKYDVIGISMPLLPSLYYAFTLGNYIKKTAPGAEIVFGGAVITRLWDDFLKFPEIFDLFCDDMIAGSGEISIVKYAEYAAGKIKKEDVPGLLYKNKDGRIINNMPAEVNINDAAPPSFKHINMKKYPKTACLTMQFAKGCTWNKCSFCTHSYPYNIKYSILEVKTAADIIENIYKQYGIKKFYIADDSMPYAFLKGLAEEIIKRKLKINYKILARFAHCYNKELFELAAKSGLTHIFWGFESASERVLKLMNKGMIKTDRNEILKEAQNAGIENRLGILFGFPGETEADIRLTIDFILKNFNKTFRYFQLNTFLLMKHSRLLDNPEKYGIYNIRKKNDFSVDYLFDNDILPHEKLSELSSLCLNKAAEIKPQADTVIKRFQNMCTAEKKGL